MSKSKPFAIFVAIIGGLFLIVAIILSKANGEKSDAAAAIITAEPNAKPAAITSINGYDITGTWYSNRADNDVLTLDSAGAFESSIWLLLGGTYSINGNNIVLTDKTGSIRNIAYKTYDNMHTLEFENGAFSHAYFRTKEEVQQAIEQEERERKERRTLIDSAVMQILTTGEWTSRSGKAKVYFSDTEYVHEYIYEDRDNIVHTFKYTITEIAETNSGYALKWEAEDIVNGRFINANDATIMVRDDNTYIIYCSAFDYMENSYYKTVIIDFEQPD